MKWHAEHVGSGGTTFGLRAAWAHEFASNNPGTSSFLNVPGAVFPVSGATTGRDALILTASVGTALTNRVYIDGAINAEFAKKSHDFGGRITVSYRW